MRTLLLLACLAGLAALAAPRSLQGKPGERRQGVGLCGAVRMAVPPQVHVLLPL